MFFGIEKKEIHFLMGAGASYASEDTSPYRVPLGSGLFDRMDDNASSWRLSNLPDELKQIFRRDFEAGMEKLFEIQEDPTWLQADMSKYFLQFHIGENNLYLQLIKPLEKHDKLYSFSTTNYETLIEQSIHRIVKRPYYGVSVDDDDRKLISVLKIHGSANFIIDANLETTGVIGCTFPSNVSIVDAPIKATSHQNALEFASMNNGFAPSIAMYAQGKTVLHAPGGIQLQQDLWKLKLRHQAAILVIVGLRVIEDDHHIWSFLGEIDVPILYVGNESEFMGWVNKTKRTGCTYLGDRFESALPQIEKYLSGEAIDPLG